MKSGVRERGGVEGVMDIIMVHIMGMDMATDKDMEGMEVRLFDGGKEVGYNSGILIEAQAGEQSD